MASCDTLVANITKACADRIVAGAGSTLYLINFSDWQNATVTYDGTNPYKITALTLASGASIFKVETSENNVRPLYEEVKEAGRVRFTHTVNFSIEKDDADTMQQVERLLLGKYVGIVTTNTEEILVLGGGGGLVSGSNPVRDLYANQGAIQITLASDEEVTEPFMPRHYVGASSPYDFTTALADITAQVAV